MHTVSVWYDDLFLAHAAPHHPERPERLQTIRRHLEQLGLAPHLHWRQPPAASHEHIAAVHSERHIMQVEQAALRAAAMQRLVYLDPDTYVNAASFDAARRAAGAACAAVEAVATGETKRAMALVRPPGHHATRDQAMGFCLFNNIAIAARHAQRHGLARIFILDWDVHHGNGTQEIFYTDPTVFFFSVHQYPFYPGTGHWREQGADAGKGFTLNVPLPAGMGDAVYMLVWERLLAPALHTFQPDLILVSAGYDAHITDPLGGMRVTTAGFAWLAQATMRYAEALGAPVVALLEGGYNPPALAESVEMTMRAMRGEALDAILATLDATPTPDEAAIVEELVHLIQPPPTA